MTWPEDAIEDAPADERDTAGALYSGDATKAPILEDAVNPWVAFRRHVRRWAMVVGLVGVIAVLAFVAASSINSHDGKVSQDQTLARRELLPRLTYPTDLKGQGPNSALPLEGSSFYAEFTTRPNHLARCLGMSDKNIDISPTAVAGQGYLNPNSGISVSDTVNVYPTAAAAAADTESAARANAPHCLKSIDGIHDTVNTLGMFTSGGFTRGQLDVTSHPLPPVGSHRAYLETIFPVTLKGMTAMTTYDFIFLQIGRSESALVLQGIGDTPSPTLIEHLVRAAAIRMRGQ